MSASVLLSFRCYRSVRCLIRSETGRQIVRPAHEASLCVGAPSNMKADPQEVAKRLHLDALVILLDCLPNCGSNMMATVREIQKLLTTENEKWQLKWMSLHPLLSMIIPPIPEVWLFKRNQLTIYIFQENKYQLQPTSRYFPNVDLGTLITECLKAASDLPKAVAKLSQHKCNYPRITQFCGIRLGIKGQLQELQSD